MRWMLPKISRQKSASHRTGQKVTAGITVAAFLLFVLQTPLLCQDLLLPPEIYRVTSGDRIAVNRVGEAEILYLVPPDGRLYIPPLGIVEVREKTMAQVALELENTEKRIEPQGVARLWAAKLVERNTADVSVDGEIQKPGPQPSGRLSIILTSAGGLKDSASGKIRVIYPSRYSPDGNEAKTSITVYDWKKAQKGEETDPYIPGGSRIYVEKHGWEIFSRKVWRVGRVVTPIVVIAATVFVAVKQSQR